MRPRAAAGLSPLTPDEVLGLRQRFVLLAAERAAWGLAYRIARRTYGAARSVQLADWAVRVRRQA